MVCGRPFTRDTARSSFLGAFIGPLLWSFNAVRTWNFGISSQPPLFIHERNRGKL